MSCARRYEWFIWSYISNMSWLMLQYVTFYHIICILCQTVVPISTTDSPLDLIEGMWDLIGEYERSHWNDIQSIFCWENDILCQICAKLPYPSPPQLLTTATTHHRNKQTYCTNAQNWMFRVLLTGAVDMLPVCRPGIIVWCACSAWVLLRTGKSVAVVEKIGR